MNDTTDTRAVVCVCVSASVRYARVTREQAMLNQPSYIINVDIDISYGVCRVECERGEQKCTINFGSWQPLAILAVDHYSPLLLFASPHFCNAPSAEVILSIRPAHRHINDELHAFLARLLSPPQ